MRLSIATKVFLGFTIVLIAFIGVSLHALLRFQAMGEILHLVNDGYLPLTRSVTRLIKVHEGRESDISKVLETEDPKVRLVLARIAGLHFPRSPKTTLEKSRKVLAGHEAGINPGTEKKALLSLMKRLDRILDYQQDYDTKAEDFLDAVESGENDKATSLLPGLKKSGRRLERELKLLDLNISGRVAAAAARAERAGSDAIWGIIILTLVAAVVSAAMMFLMASALRPLGKLTYSVRKLASGEEAPKIIIKRKDEVGLLAEEFDRLLDALSDRNARLEEQRADLLRAERLAAVGRIAAQVAHEIRNPLSSIALNVELLTEDAENSSPGMKQLVQAVSREVDRLTEVTEEYLRFARLPNPDLEPLSLKPLLFDLVNFLKPALDEKSIDLEFNMADDLEDVLADEDQLRRAFLNLMKNSLDAMPGGGRLKIVGSSVSDFIEVKIIDTGHGIPGEVLERIFDPFFSTKERGTGLGLALTQQIVMEHKGKIQVESHLGSGTTFVVRLPVASNK